MGWHLKVFNHRAEVMFVGVIELTAHSLEKADPSISQTLLAFHLAFLLPFAFFLFTDSSLGFKILESMRYFHWCSVLQHSCFAIFAHLIVYILISLLVPSQIFFWTEMSTELIERKT